MFDPKSLTTVILATASATETREAASSAVAPMLELLRQQLHGLTLDKPPRLTTYSPRPVVAGERSSATTSRLAHRLSDIRNAKALGTADDVRRVIDLTIVEVREAALGRFTSKEAIGS